MNVSKPAQIFFCETPELDNFGPVWKRFSENINEARGEHLVSDAPGTRVVHTADN